MAAESESEHLNPNISIDCTDVIENVLARFSARQEQVLQNVSTNIVNNNAAMTSNINTLTGAIEGLVKHFSPAGDSGRNTASAVDLNSAHNSGSPAGPNASDVLSINASMASQMWDMQSTTSHNSSVDGKSDTVNSEDSPKDAEVVKPLEPEQQFWDHALEDYREESDYGKEINSTIAGTTKVFWEKPMSKERREKKLQAAKIPSNCKFLDVKSTNKEIWNATATNIRACDVRLQNIQKSHSAMTSALLQVASDISEIKSAIGSHKLAGAGKVNFVLCNDHIKDALSLAGHVNQAINQHRREGFKPTIPDSLKKLVKTSTDESALLFGDDINDRINTIQGDNKARDVFLKPSDKNSKQQRWKSDNRYKAYEKPASQQDRSTGKPTSNYYAPKKSPGGQYRGYQQRQQPQQSSQQNSHQNYRGKSRGKR